MLYEKFKDPNAAASMKIVTFDEAQGTLSNFEVRKDPETGDWTIPSRDGYPADAVEQMKNAANSLVDLKILEFIEANVEDHDDFGVIEPKLEDLNVGDEGVGRLVTFKDGDQKAIASVIIGDRVKDSDDQIYVRKPGQDPVYVVALDDAPLTTKFQDWIEEDLLKLSSIDVEDLQVKDYAASLGLGGQISYKRNFEADLLKSGTEWTLKELREYDPKRPMADPTIAEVNADEKVNATKINGLQNALDDLKIVNVLRKPDGMSANLRADKDFLNDQKAVSSLAQRGFYPVPIGENGETEILSANGEIAVGLKNGVEYVLRFGNISGVSDDSSEDDKDEEASGGVNRYLLVTTRVNQDKFPAPELKPVPQSLEELEAMEKKENEGEEEMPEEGEVPEVIEDPKAETEPAADGKEMKKDDAPEPKNETDAPAEDTSEKEASDDKKDGDKKDGDKKADEKEEPASSGKESDSAKESEPEPKDDPKPADDAVEGPVEESGEVEVEGEGEASETGQALRPQDDDKDDPEADDKDADAAEPKDDASDEKSDDKEDDAEETEEEKQERLEAAQEKITKENQRKLDERKDRLSKAEASVRELNARFADWYYVIPEETYTKLTVQRADLFEKKDDPAGVPGAGAGPTIPGAPPFQFPGN